MPEPHSSLAGGILLGEKQSLGKDVENEFRIAGLSHIIVLSGYNLTIIAETFFVLLGFLPLVVASIFSAVGMVLFALLVGGGATVIRATIMGLLALVARYTGRPYDAIRALFLAGFFMVLHNPKILSSDISFQLSFIATFGLISFTPVAEKIFYWVPKKIGLREIIMTTFSAQIFVMPWLVYQVGNVSIISFVSNLLVLPSVPLAMLASFISGIFPLQVIAVPAYFLLGYELWIVHVSASLPYAAVSVPQFSLWMVALMYAGLLFIVWKFK